MPRPIHFEIAADDTARAIGFYQNVFGWKIQSWDGPMEYHLVSTGTDGPGIDGGITKREAAGDHTTNTIGVDSVDAYVEKVQAAGGRALMPKGPIPGIGWFALVADTEGNPFGLLQPDPAAK